ncbi:Metallo-hydrolase/oxidoreductase [Roridomyces roridus]|uniref:Metallo-hydrolase/oxidoreductase n=1 Tax=Roridomyces roridus TaxID=1738132 RepID=A0AAD7FYS5_9AGAR|nr:Metallo-hydrolase/oxidoreductase [Roridomyces roridus]
MLLWLVAGACFTASLFCLKRWQLRKLEPAFRATRLTRSTFVLSEWSDIYDEHPQIYVKVVPDANTILIIDTGCGGATRNPDIGLTNLREFIETVQLDCNGGAALNEGKKLDYIVVLTHCHYDHILAVEQFEGYPILVSSHSPDFVSTDNLPAHSLCAHLGIKTPTYTPTLVPHEHPIHSKSQIALGVTILHTPGHTPDELALYDSAEKMLYVGDSLYEREPIIFPSEGSIVEWMSSMDYLLAFVKEKGRGGLVRINSGHATVHQPAQEVLEKTMDFMRDIVGGKEPLRRRLVVRGEDNVVYEQEGGRFALRCPERLVLDARKLNEE